MGDDSKGRGVPATPPPLEAEVVLPELKHELDRLRVPDEAKERILLLTMRAHSGPLPPSEDFAHYGEIEPTAPRTILDMAERQQRHDHWMDKATLMAEASYRSLGILAAAVIVLVAMYLGYLLIIAGHDKAGLALLLLGPLAGIARGFIRGRDMTRLRDQPQPEPPAEKRQGRNKGKRK